MFRVVFSFEIKRAAGKHNELFTIIAHSIFQPQYCPGSGLIAIRIHRFRMLCRRHLSCHSHGRQDQEYSKRDAVRATAVPGSAPMKYRGKKALVFHSARTNPASGIHKNNHPTDSADCIGCKYNRLPSFVPTETAQITISASRNKPSGKNEEKVAMSSENVGCAQKPGENCLAYGRMTLNKTNAGATTPIVPAINFGEGICHGFQR